MQGGWRPWCAQGSSVTYIVAPAGSSPRAPAVLERRPLGVQPAELGVEALADHLAVADDTAPTSGFGLTRPRPPSASSSARRRCARSVAVSWVFIGLID